MSVVLAKPLIDVGIVANDRETTLAFWHELLGFPIEGELSFPGLSIIRLQVGDSILRVCIPDQAAQPADTGAFTGQIGLRYITLAVKNLDAVVEAAAAKGYPIPHPPREIRPGFWVAQIQDGAGVTIELSETQTS